MPESGGTLAAIVAALRNWKAREAEPAQAASEAISKKLPAAVMPRKAIEGQRKRMEQLDEIGRE